MMNILLLIFMFIFVYLVILIVKEFSKNYKDTIKIAKIKQKKIDEFLLRFFYSMFNVCLSIIVLYKLLQFVELFFIINGR